LNIVAAARNKIRQEFSNHKNENDPAKITELLKVAQESEELLRTKVIQAEETKPNIYRELKIGKAIYKDF